MLPHFQGSHLHGKPGEMRKVFPVREKIRKFKNFTGKSGNFRSVKEKSEKIISENINVYYMKMIKKIVIFLQNSTLRGSVSL